jgi:hypothetical protein
MPTQRETKMGFWVHTFGAAKGNKVLVLFPKIRVIFSGNKYFLTYHFFFTWWVPPFYPPF